jgi:hypothetical protein
MAIPKRGGGIPLRGSGSGGGKIAVSNTSGGEETLLSSAITEIVWATQDVLAFGATLDPENPNRIIIGNPPVFEPKIVFSSTPTTQVRVAVSDPNEVDTFSDGGWANSVQSATIDATPSFGSSLGRGFGADARLRIVVQHDEGVVDEQTFTCAANGSQTTNGITVTISNYGEDGDGSAYKGRINVTVDILSYLPYAQSGKFTVGLQFTEHKWGEVVTFSQRFFYDKNSTTPIISGTPNVREHDTPSERVIKYLSGIGYYTTGSKFTIETPTIDNHNDDTSHPSASLSIDSSNFGIAPYTSSPWGSDSTAWNNVGNLDSSQGFDYSADKSVGVSNFRHIGEALVGNIVRDSWNDSSNVNSNTLKVCIDTVSNPSTNTVEYFDEENKRLDNDYNTAWDSSAYCVDGEAIVFGGSLYHGADLPVITESVSGALGSLGSLTTFLPNKTVIGVSRGQPNYTPFNNEYSTFIRKFTPPSLTSTYSSFTVNILTNQALEGLLKSGDLRVHIWKSGSVNPSSPNTTYPPAFNPDNLAGSEAGSIWLHGNSNYNFGTFTDGSVQDNSNATCRTKITGSLVEATFGGNDLLGEVLVVVSFKKGVRLDEMAFTFT